MNSDRIEFIEMLAQYALIESNPSETVEHLMRILSTRCFSTANQCRKWSWDFFSLTNKTSNMKLITNSIFIYILWWRDETKQLLFDWIQYADTITIKFTYRHFLLFQPIKCRLCIILDNSALSLLISSIDNFWYWVKT